MEEERDEIERLNQEIVELRSMRGGDSDDAEDWPSSDSDRESGDEDELAEVLNSLIKDNQKAQVSEWGRNRHITGENCTKACF